MPSTTLPYCPRYVPPPPTQENLDFADLAVIDLAKALTPEGRLELFPQVRDAFRTHGFIYAINHGWTQKQTDRIFDIANVPFTSVSADEAKAYAGDPKKDGYYQGFKTRGSWRLDSENEVFDQIEHYSLNRKVYTRSHPEALRPFLPEIEDFTHHNHYNVVHPILRLLALSLELPEETFVEKHRFDAAGETCARFIKYFKRSQAEEEKSKNVWLKGHADLGSVSVLWSQPIGGLQILSPDGKWRWVRHIDNALVINTGEAMEFLTGGYFKSTIHRVTQPPADQHAYDRLGVFYFSMPDDDVQLVPSAESPVLQRVGIEWCCTDDVAPNMEAWRKGRSAAYGVTPLKQGEKEGVEEEIISGIVVKHYN
ncbi:Clavaminate synthase-like protein [Leucogyrophana mollusca]|uniref:Clavaminate synthase-like protein n=1 Tax=Leucogyrophana mollusca TaxID=85980 RepID=A0ACB8BC62_9AGAM|nr:Clavaminate synthase-like protein [Leucogyrophana mollusca]